MTENAHIPSATGPLHHSAPAGRTDARGASAAQGAAFKALLERLETQAKELAEKSDRVESPNELARAVDDAHASLHEALNLGERLLEAYRAELSRSSKSDGAGHISNASKPGSA